MLHTLLSTLLALVWFTNVCKSRAALLRSLHSKGPHRSTSELQCSRLPRGTGSCRTMASLHSRNNCSQQGTPCHPTACQKTMKAYHQLQQRCQIHRNNHFPRKLGDCPLGAGHKDSSTYHSGETWINQQQSSRHASLDFLESPTAPQHTNCLCFGHLPGRHWL